MAAVACRRRGNRSTLSETRSQTRTGSGYQHENEKRPWSLGQKTVVSWVKDRGLQVKRPWSLGEVPPMARSRHPVPAGTSSRYLPVLCLIFVLMTIYAALTRKTARAAPSSLLRDAPSGTDCRPAKPGRSQNPPRPRRKGIHSIWQTGNRPSFSPVHFLFDKPGTLNRLLVGAVLGLRRFLPQLQPVAAGVPRRPARRRVVRQILLVHFSLPFLPSNSGFRPVRHYVSENKTLCVFL